MGKKKQKTTVEETKPFTDLKSIIQKNSLFFDKLVDLIPARFYLPSDENDRPWFQGLSKAEKESAKKESRVNIKQARRDRLDPEKASKTTLDLLKENLEKKSAAVESEEEEIEVRPIFSGLDGDDRSVTYEELRQRLHKKIEELRGDRNAGGSERAKKRNERNAKNKKNNVQKKRKRESESEGNKSGKGSVEEPEKNVEKAVDEAAKGLTFSRVNLGREEKKGRKKRKLSKEKELEYALKLEEAKKDPEKGGAIAKKHLWKTAMNRASGVKVHDDPKKLRQSIEKEKKKHKKNAEKWKERVETTEKMKAGKQQTRSQNIADRIHQKKMRRIEKREKKLLRPGFEGRKEGFINEGTA